MCIAWKARESLETVISPSAIRNLNTFPSLVKSKVVLLAMMSANGQSKSARNSHFLRRLQAGHWVGGGIRDLPPPSPSPSFQPCFTVWRLKSQYGYITRSNTKSKIFLTSKLKAARCNGQNWGRRSKTSWKTAKRQLNSHFLPRLLKQGSGPGHAERVLRAKITAQMDPSPSLLGA